MAKQAAVTTTDEFLKLLETSEILGARQLDRAREIATAAADLRSAARALIKENLLTLWQAKQLVGGCAALRFGRYKLIDELGHGELGRIYLAEHGQLNRRVALKVLSRRLTADTNAVQRFLAEARVLSSLDHRNLIHVFDVGQVDDRYYLVLEYVAGRDVRKMLDEEGKASPEVAARIIQQAAAGLAAAHAKHVSHGDLKPGNLLVDEQGVVKLLDLGVAQLGHRLDATANSSDESAADDVETSGADESQRFLAPEQFAGSSATPAADLYSLGAIWHLLVTGQPPEVAAVGADPAAGARRQLQAQGNVPAEVVEMIVALLDVSPESRGASADELRRKIETWLRPLGTAPSPTSAAKPKGDDVPTPLPRDSASAGVTSVSEGVSPAAAKPPPKRALPRAKSLDEPRSTTTPPVDAETSVAATSTDQKSDSWTFAPKDEAPAAEPQFVIRTKSKGGGKGKPKSPAAASESSATPKGKDERKKLLLIVGVAATAGVLLLGLVVTLGIAFWPKGNVPKPEPLAKVDADAEDSTDSTDAEMEKGDASDAKSPDDEPADKPADGDASKPAAATPDEPAKPDEKPAEKTPEKPAVDPAKPSPPPEPKPEAKPEVKPEPKPEPKPQPKPEAKPAPKPPAPEPFKDFPKVVDLPALNMDAAANQPVALGTVHVDPKALCLVHLLGGSGAIKGKQKFALDAAENGTALRDWEIRIQDATAESGGVKIAHLSLKEETFSFQWTADAAKEPLAPALMNCVLNLATGPKSHQLALRNVVNAEPMKVDILKGGTGKWDIANAPDPAKIQLEFSLEGPFPPYTFEGPQPITADKGSITITFQLGDRPEDKQVLALKLDVLTRKNVQVTATTWFKPLFSPKPEKLTVGNFKKAQGAATAGQQQLFFVVEQMKKANKQDELSKTRLAQAEDQHNSTLRSVAQLQQVGTLIESLGETGRIHVRAYYLADDKKVELLTTGGPAPPAAAAKPK